MRLLDLNNFYTPTGGGVRTYHNRKLDHARATGAIHNILLVPDNHWSVRVDGHTTFIHAPAVPLGASGYRLVASPDVVRRVIDTASPDIIEIGSPYLLPLLVRNAIGRLGARIPTVGFYHADYPHAYVHAGLAPLGAYPQDAATELALQHMGWTYRHMTATFGASQYSLEKLHRYRVRRLFHAPLGVDTATFSPVSRSAELRERLGIPADRKLVLFLGRLAGMKRIDLLLEAWPGIRQPAKMHLLVVGHGPYAPQVNALASRYEDVHTLPYLSNPTDVAAAYASADAYLSLGEWETFSLTTLESIACGTPVVAANGGAAGELTRRAPMGSTFHPGDASDLARAIDEALSVDRAAAAEELSMFAQNHFTWNRAFSYMVGLHTRIIDAYHHDTVNEDLLPLEGRWNSVPDLPPIRG